MQLLRDIPADHYVGLDLKETPVGRLLSESELKRAEPIVQHLEGLTISSAKKLLYKVSEALDHLANV